MSVNLEVQKDKIGGAVVVSLLELKKRLFAHDADHEPESASGQHWVTIKTGSSGGGEKSKSDKGKKGKESKGASGG